MARNSQGYQQPEFRLVGTPNGNIHQPVGKKLRELGLDTEFLCWLEGEAERLPRIDAVRSLKAEELVAAVRAFAWLEGLECDPLAVAPVLPEQWRLRYFELGSLLWNSLKNGLFFSLLTQHEDLAALEHVLEMLLPESNQKDYQDDFRRLRRKGLPFRVPFSADRRRPRGGGKPESEQTARMRAALAYVRTVSDTPYVDLADFWNECAGSTNYGPNEIRSRLRKGHPLRRTPEAAERLLDHWTTIYRGNLMVVFPGPFPLSGELSKLFESKSGRAADP